MGKADKFTMIKSPTLKEMSSDSSVKLDEINNDRVCNNMVIAVTQNEKTTPGRQELIKLYRSKPCMNRCRSFVYFIVVFSWLVLIAMSVVLVLTTERCRRPERWAKVPVLYQVFVRSFHDSDNDGVGDLNGLSQKLDYLRWLGVGGVIIDSIYPYDHNSPFGETMAESVTNWTDVSQDIGEMRDMEALVKAAEEKGLKIYLTFNPNHVSTAHAWFVASATPVDAVQRYRNYFVWAQCMPSRLIMPNNWKNMADGGSAWTYSTFRHECYLHQFSSQLPDLNIRSSYVQAEIESALRFWMKVGVSGFYINHASYLHEDYDLRDDDVTYRMKNLRESRDVIRRWSDVIREDGRKRKLLIGLDDSSDSERAVFYKEIQSDNVYLMSDQLATSCGEDVNCIRRLILSNVTHRSVLQLSSPASSRVASREPHQSEVLHLLMLTSAAAASLYYGDEIAMTDSSLDNSTIIKGMEYSQYRSITPIPWSNQNDSITWIPISNNGESSSKESMLWYVKRLLELRMDGAFKYGMTHVVDTCPFCVAYIREWDGTNRYFVIANLGFTTSQLHITNNLVPKSASVLLATRNIKALYPIGKLVTLEEIRLPANEGLVLMWPYER